MTKTHIVRCFSGQERFTSRPMSKEKAERIAASILRQMAYPGGATMEGKRIERVAVLSASRDFLSALALG